MTPIPPDRSDEVRRSITAAYQLKRAKQLAAMRTEIQDLTTAIKAAGLRLSLLAGQVNVLLLELRAEETTTRIPVLPEPKERRERPYLD